jgi:hypothetical protein
MTNHLTRGRRDAVTRRDKLRDAGIGKSSFNMAMDGKCGDSVVKRVTPTSSVIPETAVSRYPVRCTSHTALLTGMKGIKGIGKSDYY